MNYNVDYFKELLEKDEYDYLSHIVNSFMTWQGTLLDYNGQEFKIEFYNNPKGITECYMNDKLITDADLISKLKNKLKGYYEEDLKTYVSRL